MRDKTGIRFDIVALFAEREREVRDALHQGRLRGNHHDPQGRVTGFHLNPYINCLHGNVGGGWPTMWVLAVEVYE